MFKSAFPHSGSLQVSERADLLDPLAQTHDDRMGGERGKDGESLSLVLYSLLASYGLIMGCHLKSRLWDCRHMTMHSHGSCQQLVCRELPRHVLAPR